MTPIITLICIALGILIVGVLAQLFDEGDPAGLVLLKIGLFVTLPLWLPLVLVWHVCGVLAGEHDWKGEGK